MVSFGNIGNGGIQQKLNVNGAVNSVGTFVNEAANNSIETATFNLVKRFGENMRGRVKSFTGGNFLNNLGQNIRR